MTGKFYTAAEWAVKQAKEAAKDAPKLPRGRPLSLVRPKRVRLTLDDIWNEFQDAVGNCFPDGDPIDQMSNHMAKHRYDYQDITRAVKKHNRWAKSVSDYLGFTWEEYGEERLAEVQESGWGSGCLHEVFVEEDGKGGFKLATNPWWDQDRQTKHRKARANEDTKAA